jgi:16S rRNA (cytosine967-C5)-methyltransferase
VGDAGDPSSWWDGERFRRILLDAPCSGSGVIRRHPDIKWLRRERDIAELQRGQQRLLAALWPLLEPGGRLVYATCSVFYAENEAVISAFMADHDDAQALPLTLPVGHSVGYGQQILTGESGVDGFYYACLQKR